MLTLVEKILFVVLAGAMLYLTTITFGRMARVIGRGQGPDKLALDHLPQRVWAGLVSLITQGSIIRNRTFTSVLHYGIAWGFLFYFLVNGIDALEGYLPHQWHIWDAEHNYWPGNVYRLLADLFTVSGLTGVIYFLVRRFVAQDKVLTTHEQVTLLPQVRRGGIRRDSLIVGAFILLHLGARFTGAASDIALSIADPWQPFGSFYGGLLSGLSPTFLTVLQHAAWWLALGSIFVFLPYFPYTKHAHLFLGPLNFMTRPDRGALGAMTPLNLEDETQEKFGVATLSDLSQTQILDAFACIMCNRCQEACPAYNTGKQLSPAAIEINKRYYIWENFIPLASGAPDDKPLLEYALSESALWACTTCGACSEVCPVGNEPMMDILDMRRNQVLTLDQYPAELTNTFQGIERRCNPWGATNSRLEWAAALPFPVPTVEENPDFEYLFWVGCAGAFDPGAQKVAQAVATILNAAGVSFAVLGDQESCTGDPARRAGNEYLFQAMAQANIETLHQYGVERKRIVTSCPHCLTTLGVEYKALGGDFTVFHHTQLIADLVGKGRLRLNGNQLEHVTFHDPCYLGRHNNIYDDPRLALAEAGVTLLEMDRSRRNSFCCGAGGAQMWKEEEHGSDAVNLNRYREALATGATTLAVGCPFCAVMLRDANGKHGDALRVQDVAEIVAARLAPTEELIAAD